MRAKVEVSGLAALSTRLKAAARAVEQAEAIAALKAGGEVIAAEARARMERLSGATARTVEVGEDAQGAERDVKPHVFVGASKDGKRNYISRFLEDGTMHQPAEPWLRPALEAGADRAIDAVGGHLKRRIG